MQNVVKSGIPNKEVSDFIKLYMYEKERSRLKSEEIKILQRMEIINCRLKEIQDYYDKKANEMHVSEPRKSNRKKNEEVKQDFKTITIDY